LDEEGSDLVRVRSARERETSSGSRLVRASDSSVQRGRHSGSVLRVEVPIAIHRDRDRLVAQVFSPTPSPTPLRRSWCAPSRRSGSSPRSCGNWVPGCRRRSSPSWWMRRIRPRPASRRQRRRRRSPSKPETFLRPTVIVRATPGEEGTNSAFLAVDGIYVVDCTLFVGGQRTHTWWPATLEVTR